VGLFNSSPFCLAFVIHFSLRASGTLWPLCSYFVLRWAGSNESNPHLSTLCRVSSGREQPPRRRSPTRAYLNDSRSGARPFQDTLPPCSHEGKETKGERCQQSNFPSNWNLPVLKLDTQPNQNKVSTKSTNHHRLPSTSSRQRQRDKGWKSPVDQICTNQELTGKIASKTVNLVKVRDLIYLLYLIAANLSIQTRWSTGASVGLLCSVNRTHQSTDSTHRRTLRTRTLQRRCWGLIWF
jgi:hypothetical protein